MSLFNITPQCVNKMCGFSHITVYININTALLYKLSLEKNLKVSRTCGLTIHPLSRKSDYVSFSMTHTILQCDSLEADRHSI